MPRPLLEALKPYQVHPNPYHMFIFQLLMDSIFSY
jgi:hypothetical protein